MKKKFFIIPIFLILLSCGFKPINQKNSATISIQNLEVIGEQRIAYILKSIPIIRTSETQLVSFHHANSASRCKENSVVHTCFHTLGIQGKVEIRQSLG